MTAHSENAITALTRSLAVPLLTLIVGSSPKFRPLVKATHTVKITTSQLPIGGLMLFHLYGAPWRRSHRVIKSYKIGTAIGIQMVKSTALSR